METRPRTDWHLDRRVPLALLTGLVVQAAAVFYWGGAFKTQTEERLGQIERRLEGFAARSDALTQTVTQQGQTIAVLLSRIDDTNRNLDRLRAEVATTNDLLRELLTQTRP